MMKKLRKPAFLLVLALVFSCCSGLVASAAGVEDYTDVPKSAWYRSDVEYALARGMVTGMSATTFDPGGLMTRSQFITILGRAMNVDTAMYSGTKFTDVSNQYFAPYVYWGIACGIVNGTSNTTFSPNAGLTREQMAAMMGRAISALGFTMEEVNKGTPNFPDGDWISSYAKGYVEDCWKAGLLSGDAGTGRLRPQDTVTRAEGTAVLVRFAKGTEGQTPKVPEIPEAPKYVQFTDSVYGLTMEVPEAYQDGIACNPAGRAAFAFREPTSYEALYIDSLGIGGGLLWAVMVYTVEDFCKTFSLDSTEWVTVLPGPEIYMMGRTEEYVYVLDEPSGMQFTEETELAYRRYTQASASILKNFLKINGIEMNPDWENYMPISGITNGGKVTLGTVRNLVYNAADHVGVSDAVKEQFVDFIESSDWIASDCIDVPYQTEWSFETKWSGEIVLCIKIWNTDLMSVDPPEYLVSTLWYDGQKVWEGLKTARPEFYEELYLNGGVKKKAYSALNADDVSDAIKDIFIRGFGSRPDLVEQYGGDDWVWVYSKNLDGYPILECYGPDQCMQCIAIENDQAVLTTSDTYEPEWLNHVDVSVVQKRIESAKNADQVPSEVKNAFISWFGTYEVAKNRLMVDSTDAQWELVRSGDGIWDLVYENQDGYPCYYRYEQGQITGPISTQAYNVSAEEYDRIVKKIHGAENAKNVSDNAKSAASYGSPHSRN